jgi:hypothetical protein
MAVLLPDYGVGVLGVLCRGGSFEACLFKRGSGERRRDAFWALILPFATRGHLVVAAARTSLPLRVGSIHDWCLLRIESG